MKKLLFICITFFALNANAQAPEKMSYQAVIRNPANVLVTNQSVGMRITILQGSVAGSTVYAEIHTATTNTNGLVSLEIGGGISLTGTFASINWAGGPYFIKTETDPAGGTSYTIAGTSQLLSTPYALFAKNGAPAGGTANQVLAKVNGNNYNTQWVTPSAGTPSTTALPNTFLGRNYNSGSAVYYISPFTTNVGNAVSGVNTFYITTAANLNLTFFSYDDEALTFELFEVVPAANTAIYSTAGIALATCSTSIWSFGAASTGNFTYAAVAGKIYIIKITKTLGGNLTTNGCFYQSFYAN